jgi:hypothetical protein
VTRGCKLPLTYHGKEKYKKKRKETVSLMSLRALIRQTYSVTVTEIFFKFIASCRMLASTGALPQMAF